MGEGGISLGVDERENIAEDRLCRVSFMAGGGGGDITYRVLFTDGVEAMVVMLFIADEVNIVVFERVGAGSIIFETILTLSLSFEPDVIRLESRYSGLIGVVASLISTLLTI